MTKRVKPALRKDQILTAALTLAAESHYTKVSRDQIAALCGVTGTAVQYHFGTMPQLRRAIVRFAIQVGNYKVIAQALVAEDTIAVNAPEDVKRKALEGLL